MCAKSNLKGRILFGEVDPMIDDILLLVTKIPLQETIVIQIMTDNCMRRTDQSIFLL